jgi:hypothetical protein
MVTRDASHSEVAPGFRGESAPCDGCGGATMCGLRRLACAAFVEFAAGVPPSRWKLAPRSASREIYLALFRARGIGRPRKSCHSVERQTQQLR